MSASDATELVTSSAIDSSSMPTDGIRLTRVDVLFLASLGTISLAYVRPLLEEWGFNASLSYATLPEMFISITAGQPTRPLHMVYSFLGWILGGGHWLGWAGIKVATIFATYFAVKWALRRNTSGLTLSVLALLGTVLLPWPGVWLGRFGAAQLSWLLGVIALGYAIRYIQRGGPWHWIGTVMCVALSLCFYQSLAALFVGSAFALALLARQTGEHLAKTLRVLLAPFAGLAVYAIIASGMLKVASGHSSSPGYEEALSQGATMGRVFANILEGYETILSETTAVLAMLLMLTIFLGTVLGSGTTNWAWGRLQPSRVTAVVFGIVVLTPLASSPYALVSLHVSDPERVLFPVSAALFLTCTLLLFNRDHTLVDLQVGSAAALAVSALVVAALSASVYGRYAGIQRTVLETIKSVDQRADTRSILVMDLTGELGDFYTLLPPTIQQAVASGDLNWTIDLCTAPEAERRHPFWDQVIGSGVSTKSCAGQGADVVIQVSRDGQGHLMAVRTQ